VAGLARWAASCVSRADAERCPALPPGPGAAGEGPGLAAEEL